MKRIVVAASIAASALGCDGGTADRGKLSVIQREIFTPTCAVSGCHAGATPQAGMNLSEGNAHAALVNVDSVNEPARKRVLPGDPGASLLVQAVEGTSTSVPQMPFGRTPLPAADIQAIRDWIQAGANND